MKTQYKDLPLVLRENYDKLGIRDGYTPNETISAGEQYYINYLKETSKYKRSIFETKTRKQIYKHLLGINVDLMDIADYLEIIDSPHAKDASEIEATFARFAGTFAVFDENDKKFFPDECKEEEDFCGRIIKDE